MFISSVHLVTVGKLITLSDYVDASILRYSLTLLIPHHVAPPTSHRKSPEVTRFLLSYLDMIITNIVCHLMGEAVSPPASPLVCKSRPSLY